MTERPIPEGIAKPDNKDKSPEYQRAKGLFESNADVWVRRSSGSWQKCKIEGFFQGGDQALVVKWQDEGAGKELFKMLEVGKFVALQDEHQG